jgi:3-isopropylmalate/(R)-2-methylmalate dehydratase small subunit
MSIVKVTAVQGSGVPVRGNDIDTDRIIPARFLKCVTFDGIGEHAFADDIAALKTKGEIHPFVDPKFAKAGVLVSNKNFGCGSSREHAPQSLMRWGIGAIIAESYSEIFHGNCVSLGVPCFTATNVQATELQTFIEANPDASMDVDVAAATISFGGKVMELSIQKGAQGQFLDGSWNARAQLLAGAEQVKALAKTLSYVNDYA